jgi:hypothetical protein
MNQTITSDKLFSLTVQIADFCYEIAADLSDDEKYPVQYTLKTNAFEITNNVAEALGSVDPRDAFWKLGMTKRALFSVRNTLQQSHKRKILVLNPEIMIKINEAINETDRRIEQSKKMLASYFEILDADTYKVKGKLNV